MTNNKQQTEINAVEYLDKVNQFAKENNTDKPKQQTAVEWLYGIAYNRELTVADWKQAKEMEKERMIGLLKWMNKIASENPMRLETDDDDIVQQYYKQTYGGGEQ
jgi:hypothetical protein